MYEIITLDNSLRVVIEHIPYVKSATIGVWIGAGSCNENNQNSGISHFIEHMLFKGTLRRSAKQIAECIDDIGGQINAFTSKECTCFYAKTLSSHLDISIDLLSDMLFNSRLDERDIAVEKGVIIEEINMYEDTPEELVHDLLQEAVWKGSSLANNILGDKISVVGITKAKILEYMMDQYTPQNSVIAVVGNIDRERLIAQLNDAFGSWQPKRFTMQKLSMPIFYNKEISIKKDIEQIHYCMGFQGFERDHDKAYDLLVVNSILGGGMSSKLFQKIREEKGLVYAIYSFNTSFNHTGLMGIYAGMNPTRIAEVTELIWQELSQLKEKGLCEKEINRSKEQIKSGLILGLESTSSRMNSYGRGLLLKNRILTMDDMIERLDRVNVKRTAEVIDQVFSQAHTTVVVGPFDC